MATTKQKDVLYVDVMVNGYFYTQVKYPHWHLFEVNTQDVLDYVLKRYPSLKNKKFNLLFGERVIV